MRLSFDVVSAIFLRCDHPPHLRPPGGNSPLLPLRPAPAPALGRRIFQARSLSEAGALLGARTPGMPVGLCSSRPPFQPFLTFWPPAPTGAGACLNLQVGPGSRPNFNRIGFGITATVGGGGVHPSRFDSVAGTAAPD